MSNLTNMKARIEAADKAIKSELQRLDSVGVNRHSMRTIKLHADDLVKIAKRNLIDVDPAGVNRLLADAELDEVQNEQYS